MKKIINFLFRNRPAAMLARGWESDSTTLNAVIESMQDKSAIKPSISDHTIAGGDRNLQWSYVDINLREYRQYVTVNGSPVYLEPHERKVVRYLAKRAKAVAINKYIENAKANRTN